MRTIAVILLVICQYVATQAQEPVLLRTLSNGGRYGIGTIAELSISDQTFADVYDFKILNAGGRPDATQLIEWGGKLWGMTYDGGANNQGVLFKYDTLTHENEVILDFSHPIGSYPRGSLLAASNGLMYGLTTQGGQHGGGVLFEYSPITNAYEVKIHFSESTGDGPFGSLVEASNGLLYGTTYGGGVYELGTLFSYNPQTSELIFLHNFIGVAANPTGKLCYASNGKLYGLTINGGSLDSGAFYEYDINTNTFTLIHGFTQEESPYGSVIEADDQKLYGMTRYGGTINYGYIFSYKPASGVFSQLYNFNEVNGGMPHGDLFQASNGLLYGLTLVGGNAMKGVLFEFDPANAGYTEKHAFNESEGYFPHGSPMQASNGKLYGLTRSGGYPGMGGLFQYDLADDSLAFNLYFNEPEGKNPSSNLRYISDNKFIGTINIGGKHNKGAVYLYNHATKSVESTVSFDGANGANPIGQLFKAQNGKYYGMTSKGGTNNFGVIFEYLFDDDKISKVVDFEGWNGRQPMGSLSQHENGKLYAMTYSGGKDGAGTLIEFDPTAMTCDSVFSFTMSKGFFPKGSLCSGPGGVFYGLTSAGGSGGSGVFFRYNPATNNFQLIINLNYITGYSPVGTPFLAGNGKIYFTTTIGGLFGKGTVIEYNPANEELQVFHSFDGVNGSNCKSDLMQATDGLLYGTTANGGENNGGVLFSLNTETKQFAKLTDFSDTCGHRPMYGALVQIPMNVGTSESLSFNYKIFDVCQNPVVDDFILLKDLNKANQISVFDLLGRKVYSQNTSSVYHQIPVEGLMDGVYLIKVEDHKNSIQIKKILLKRRR